MSEEKHIHITTTLWKIMTVLMILQYFYKDILLTNDFVDRANQRVIHRIDRLKRPTENRERFRVAKVRVRRHENAALGLDEFLRGRHLRKVSVSATGSRIRRRSPPCPSRTMRAMRTLANLAVLATLASMHTFFATTLCAQQELPRYGGVNLVNETPEQHA
jgi:hypothetical protein